MARTVLDHVMREIADRKATLINAVSSGAAKDFAEYQHMCGEIRGLALAHAQVEDLVRRLEHGDDIDD